MYHIRQTPPLLSRIFPRDNDPLGCSLTPDSHPHAHATDCDRTHRVIRHDDLAR